MPTMRESDALYRAVVAHPDDDTPRLVYADWLQENGREEEAELVRVQCALDASPPDHPEYAHRLAREGELKLWLAAHSPGPSPRFPAGLHLSGGRDWWHTTRRGFARFLEFDGNAYSGLKPMRDLAKAVDRAFAALPTRWLVVRFVTVAQLAELLRHPVAGQVERITVQLGVEEADGDEAAAVIAESGLRNLRGASLAFPLGEPGAAALAASPNAAGLRWLALSPWTLPPDAVRAFGAAAWFRDLEHLELDCELPAESFEELCRLRPFPRLHSLELGESSYPVGAWDAFARCGLFPRLARLNFGAGETDLSGGRAEALFRGDWPRLADLDLSGCAIGNEGAAALARTPWAGSLRRLDLAYNNLGPAGFAAVAGSRRLAGLKSLDLSYNTPGPRGVRALAGNPALRGLVGLLLKGDTLHSRGLTPADIHEFLTRLNLTHLRHLDLSGRPVGGRAARLLAAEKFGSLTRLVLSECKLTDAAVAELVTAPALQNLVELNLEDNRLKDGLAPLADPANLPRLSACELFGNRIGAKLAKLLRRRPAGA